MTRMYRIRATETDTGITRESVTIHPYEAAVAIARIWAETYYGENGATWCTPKGEGGYLAGRLHDDGFREGGTCIIRVEPDGEPA
jgi:hypothetical protein